MQGLTGKVGRIGTTVGGDELSAKEPQELDVAVYTSLPPDHVHQSH